MQLFEVYSNHTTLEKSGQEENGLIPVKIKINSPTPDRDGDRILAEAFDKETMDDYLANGIIDFDHQSVRGKTEEEKAKAIIGKPRRFYFENGSPVIEGVLFKDNKYVRDAIFPAISVTSNEPITVWKASVGGGIIRKSIGYDPEYRKKIGDISKIKLIHVAVTPSYKAVHPDTFVQMIKSKSIENLYLDKSFEITGSPQSASTLIFRGFEPFYKALTSGYQTDMEGMSGGQVLSTQDLEGAKNSSSSLDGVIEQMLTYMKGTTEIISYDRLLGFLEGKGFGRIDAINLINFLNEKFNTYVS